VPPQAGEHPAVFVAVSEVEASRAANFSAANFPRTPAPPESRPQKNSHEILRRGLASALPARHDRRERCH